jgi:hypothetical protein
MLVSVIICYVYVGYTRSSYACTLVAELCSPAGGPWGTSLRTAAAEVLRGSEWVATPLQAPWLMGSTRHHLAGRNEEKKTSNFDQVRR